MVSDPIVSTDPLKIVDRNGVEFTEGCTIQISKETKAYQVAKKGYGSFDEETKAFVPLDGANDQPLSSIPRVQRCLVLPKGLRAEVRKVYDINEFDATAPVVAKFMNDRDLGGEYVSPVTFSMHFETNEVEVVE